MTRKNAITHLAHKIIGCKTTGESKADGVNVVALEMATIALEEQEPKWNPIKTRPLNDDELKLESQIYGCKCEREDGYRCLPPLPRDGQEILVCDASGQIYIDTFYIASEFELGRFDEEDEDRLVAWMPLPEPYKEVK